MVHVKKTSKNMIKMVNFMLCVFYHNKKKKKLIEEVDKTK